VKEAAKQVHPIPGRKYVIGPPVDDDLTPQQMYELQQYQMQYGLPVSQPRGTPPGAPAVLLVPMVVQGGMQPQYISHPYTPSTVFVMQPELVQPVLVMQQPQPIYVQQGGPPQPQYMEAQQPMVMVPVQQQQQQFGQPQYVQQQQPQQMYSLPQQPPPVYGQQPDAQQQYPPSQQQHQPQGQYPSPSPPPHYQSPSGFQSTSAFQPSDMFQSQSPASPHHVAPVAPLSDGYRSAPRPSTYGSGSNSGGSSSTADEEVAANHIDCGGVTEGDKPPDLVRPPSGEGHAGPPSPSIKE
jgi:hypothetical protein